jgi:hypothetical protein
MLNSNRMSSSIYPLALPAAATSIHCPARGSSIYPLAPPAAAASIHCPARHSSIYPLALTMIIIEYESQVLYEC